LSAASIEEEHDSSAEAKPAVPADRVVA